VLLSWPLSALLLIHFFVLFVGGNKGIGVEGWAAVGRALSSKRNLKKLDLCE
jgi:hypothetical protein